MEFHTVASKQSTAACNLDGSQAGHRAEETRPRSGLHQSLKRIRGVGFAAAFGAGWEGGCGRWFPNSVSSGVLSLLQTSDVRTFLRVRLQQEHLNSPAAEVVI